MPPFVSESASSHSIWLRSGGCSGGHSSLAWACVAVSNSNSSEHTTRGNQRRRLLARERLTRFGMRRAIPSFVRSIHGQAHLKSVMHVVAIDLRGHGHTHTQRDDELVRMRLCKATAEENVTEGVCRILIRFCACVRVPRSSRACIDWSKMSSAC